MTELLLYSAEPVFEIDGNVRGELARDLLRLDVEETTTGLKTLTMHLAGTPPYPEQPQVPELYLDGSVIDFGRSIQVSLGPTGAARTVFRGDISAIEATYAEGGEPEVAVFAEDKLMKMRMTRRMRTYEKMTDAEIAEAIAAEHGLTAKIDAEGPRYDVVQQWNMSDLAFLRERASRHRAELWIDDDDTLHFESRERRSATEIALVQGNELVEVQIRADLAHQRTRVSVAGYDVDRRATIDEDADGSAIRGEVTGGRTGPEVLDRALGPRESFLVRDVPLTDEEARERARSEMLRRARAFVVAVGTTNGTPDMVVGSRLSLERVGGPFNGAGYYATRVHHSYDRIHGFRTRFTAERATVNEGG